jgi:hypothetical protein
MTTDLRAEAAAAAREWAENDDPVAYAGFLAGARWGHSAGVVDGAMAAFEWIEKQGFKRKTVGDAPLFSHVGPMMDFPKYLASRPAPGTDAARPLQPTRGRGED